MAKKKRYNKSDINKRESNYIKYGSSDKVASIYGELQTAENTNTHNGTTAQSLTSR